MSNLPLAVAHPVLLVCGIILGALVLVVIVRSLRDIIRYIQITWM